jgi:hypothetical protein
MKVIEVSFSLEGMLMERIEAVKREGGIQS